MKYKLTDRSIEYNGRILSQIVCDEQFDDIRPGDLGGWIENYRNLSQYGNAWVFPMAMVMDDAVVHGDARIRDRAIIYDKANIAGKAIISDSAKIFGCAVILGNAFISDHAEVYDHAIIRGQAFIHDYAKVFGYAVVSGNSNISIYAKICGSARVTGEARITGNAIVFGNEDYIVFKNNWSSGRYFTWTKSDNMWQVGCFHGTGNELIAKAYEDSEISGKHYEAYVKFVESLQSLN